MEEVEEREKSKLRRYDIVAHIAMVGLERSCDISTQAAGSDDYAVNILLTVFVKIQRKLIGDNLTGVGQRSKTGKTMQILDI